MQVEMRPLDMNRTGCAWRMLAGFRKSGNTPI
jgi:hypothetical protein